jgi:hypothetical protein
MTPHDTISLAARNPKSESARKAKNYLEARQWEWQKTIQPKTYRDDELDPIADGIDNPPDDADGRREQARDKDPVWNQMRMRPPRLGPLRFMAGPRPCEEGGSVSNAHFGKAVSAALRTFRGSRVSHRKKNSINS